MDIADVFHLGEKECAQPPRNSSRKERRGKSPGEVGDESS